VQGAASAALARGWKLLSLEVRSPGDIDAAFKAASDARVGSLLVFASTPLFVHAQHVTDLARKYRLPAMYELRRFVEAGGLMSYGVDDKDIWRHAASYVDKILKGAPARQPADRAAHQARAGHQPERRHVTSRHSSEPLVPSNARSD
jgi:putative ABC transport system substrate-binding protein